jgi:hypothetical protein
VAKTGYKNLIGDFEAYSRSCDTKGKPLRPEIYEKEHTKEKSFYHFGFKYNLPGTEKAIHFPFNKIAGLPKNRLRVFLRTDRIAQYGVRYFMGMKGYTLKKYVSLIKKYSKQNRDESEGALIIFADDAEYVGTNGWFKLKYENKPDNTFEHTPDSGRKLTALIKACRMMGEFCTFDDACRLKPITKEITFDDDTAWHGGRASTWAETPMSCALRPWQALVRNKLLRSRADEDTRKMAWYHLTNSYNSDGQWPPTLPEAPHIIHPFNYRYCFENLVKAELLVGGVDRNRLKTDSVRTIKEILGLQQNLVLRKARTLKTRGTAIQKKNAGQAMRLITRSRNLDSLMKDRKVLHPSEYAVRAELLVEARRLVGGIEIEVVKDM